MFKKKSARLLLSLVFILLLTSFSRVYAQDHRLESLDIDVLIHSDGSATITERRLANLIEGTENYIVIENMGDSEIHSFTVMEDGVSYDYVEDWNINASREEKTFKNGIIETSAGYELAWGIGEYGYHDYTLKYTVTNFIKQLNDSQILFWRFVNDYTNIPPESLTITIRSDDYSFSQDRENIWAFGYPGEIGFRDGAIFSQSTDSLFDSDYATILTRFDDGMFETGDYLNQSFEEVRERAFEGSDYDEESSSEGGILGFITGIIGFIVPLIFVIGSFTMRNKLSTKAKTFKRKYKEEYYRDIPYEGEYINAYSALYNMGASDFEKLLTSFILKWVKEDRISILKEEKGLIRKRDVTSLSFTNKTMNEGSLEGDLFNMMYKAAGSNGILEENEFTKWARSNYQKLTKWEDKVKNDSMMILQEEGYYNLQKKKKLIIFTDYDLQLTPKGEQLEERVYKYVNYLYDFSLLNEHEAINVKIWDEIMIWAALLGLTDQVRSEFIKLYPNYEMETVYTGNTIFMTRSLTRNVARARTQASTRSSGGGGMVSRGGGGGGSFGGGSGGGTR